MKKIKISVSALALALLFGSITGFIAPENPVKKENKAAAVTTLDVDPAASTLNWTAKKVGGQHTGTVKLTKGNLQVNGKKLVGGSFVMDMTSIADVDITNPEFNQKLTGHLKSEDFFQ